MLVVSLSSLVGCAEPAREEVARAISPDQLVAAVLIKKMADATVSTPFEIYIVPVGEKVHGEPSLRGDKFEDIKLVWKEPKFLEVHYSKGRIFTFTNFWQSGNVQNFGYTVELRLKPQRNEPSL